MDSRTILLKSRLTTKAKQYYELVGNQRFVDEMRKYINAYISKKYTDSDSIQQLNTIQNNLNNLVPNMNPRHYNTIDYYTSTCFCNLQNEELIKDFLKLFEVHETFSYDVIQRLERIERHLNINNEMTIEQNDCLLQIKENIDTVIDAVNK